jgi:4-amino-4-deoxychorismate lyase
MPADGQPAVLVDGLAGEVLSVHDRGLAYGDGLFETLAVRDGRPCLWQRHLDRLFGGARRLGIPLPDPARLRAEALALSAGQARAVLKLILTRSGGGRGYRPPADAAVRRIVMRTDWPASPAEATTEGVAVRLCRTRCALSPDLAGLKHLGRLEQVLARAEWDDPAVPEGIMLDPAGRVVEATQSNLFVETDGRLATPRLDQAGVAGIVRGLVLEAAAELGQAVEETRLSLADLQAADALYLTNSLIGVWPVARFEAHAYAPRRPMHAAVARAVERVYGP